MGKISIYGILNVTPDSFSDGGDHYSVQSACEYALSMMEDGADVIDIGGMSTRPGFTDVSCEEEIQRIIPVIKEIRNADPSAIISVDTFRARTADAAIGAGADIINDISGLMGDPDMAGVISSAGVKTVLMRNGLNGDSLDANQLIEATLDKARSAGIKDDKIILDPGVGFTKTRQEDIELIRHIPDMISLWGYPVLLGVSRKRITAEFYQGPVEPKQRVGASIALCLYGISLGASALRVHDVKQTVAAVRVFNEMRDKDEQDKP